MMAPQHFLMRLTRLGPPPKVGWSAIGATGPRASIPPIYGLEPRSKTPLTCIENYVINQNSPMRSGEVEPKFFLLRVTRLGPLVPARLRWLDHAPEDPAWNKLDRGGALILCADIAGVDVPPEDITERGHIAAGHWKFAAPISAAEYAYQIAHLRWSERAQPSNPTLAPRRAVDPAQIAMPDFTLEHRR